MAYDLSPWNRVGERYKLDMSEAPSGKIIISYAPLENLTEESEKYTTDEAYAEQDPLEGCGEYYSYDMLLMPYVLDRPLNRADIIGMTADELKILRNQFYALYGRAFDTESLRDYFSEEPWYRALISPSEFDDSVFTLLERRNIEFLKAIEAEYSEEPEYYDKKAKEEREALDALEEAPYKDIIPEYGEVYVEIYSDPQNATDKGIYYEANGRIALPVSVTPEQYIEVVENNGEAEVIINELTGEKRIMRRCENPNYGDCVLYDPNDSSEGTTYFLSDSYSGDYTFWRDSADTFFKDVYSGKIYVMKGAEEEYIHNFAAQRDINDEDWGAGSWRHMDFDETDVNMTSAYWGNSPVFNEKGYLVGLYWWGD